MSRNVQWMLYRMAESSSPILYVEKSWIERRWFFREVGETWRDDCVLCCELVMVDVHSLEFWWQMLDHVSFYGRAPSVIAFVFSAGEANLAVSVRHGRILVLGICSSLQTVRPFSVPVQWHWRSRFGAGPTLMRHITLLASRVWCTPALLLLGDTRGDCGS